MFEVSGDGMRDMMNGEESRGERGTLVRLVCNTLRLLGVACTLGEVGRGVGT